MVTITGPPFEYDPADFGISFLWRWQGTILPLVMKSPIFWMLMTSHATMLYAHDRFPDEPVLDWKAAMITSGLLTFQLVSYGQQCLARYFALYNHCVGLSGAVMEWTALIKLEFGRRPRDVQWNALRMFLGALQLHYAMLGGDDVEGDDGHKNKKGVTDDEWRAIRSRNFLSRDEISKLQAYPGFQPFLPIGWALTEIERELHSIYTKPTSNEVFGLAAPRSPGEGSSAAPMGAHDTLLIKAAFAPFREVAFSFRSHSAQTFAMLHAPVPFAYFHLMKFLLLVSLMIIDYALVCAPPYHPVAGAWQLACSGAWLQACWCFPLLGHASED